MISLSVLWSLILATVHVSMVFETVSWTEGRNNNFSFITTPRKLSMGGCIVRAVLIGCVARMSRHTGRVLT